MRKLIEAAVKAMENAYVPYSKFKVGAAVLLKNGEIVTGCNIEYTLKRAVLSPQLHKP